MRLDKFVSHATGIPRDITKRVIRKKQVTVNNSVVTKASFHISEEDQVAFDGDLLALPQPRYLMLHKPVGYVCATEDAEHPIVLDLIAGIPTEGLSIAGRLDIDTTGLVLLSDDGQWLHRVTSPRHLFAKVYRATLQEPVDDNTIQSFTDGILLRSEDKITAPAQCRELPDNGAEVTLNEGRYHQVKRMFAACGNHVTALHRLQIGAVKLDEDLQSGQYRQLTAEEVASFNA